MNWISVSIHSTERSKYGDGFDKEIFVVDQMKWTKLGKIINKVYKLNNIDVEIDCSNGGFGFVFEVKFLDLFDDAIINYDINHTNFSADLWYLDQLREKCNDVIEWEQKSNKQKIKSDENSGKYKKLVETLKLLSNEIIDDYNLLSEKYRELSEKIIDEVISIKPK